jgi:hypothetical protein
LLTITQGLAGAVSEYCLDRREAADGGAAAVVVVAVADGAVAEPLADDPEEAVGDDVTDAEEELPVDAALVAEVDAGPLAAGGAWPEAVCGAVPEAAEPVAGESGCAGPGVQAARADMPAPVISSRATARRVGRGPDWASAEGSGEQLQHMRARPSSAASCARNGPLPW